MSRLQEMRERMAAHGAEHVAKIDKAIASQAHEPEVSKVDSAPAEHQEEPDTAPAAVEAEPAPREVKVRPKAVKAAKPVEVGKAEKRSTSLYLSGGAMRALRTLAAQQGVRPHRVVDDALRAHFKRHGLDFDALNAQD